MTPDRMDVKAARAGYLEGLEAGRREGFAVGQQRFGILFEGTSIIIPTRNRRRLLQQCVGSILSNTQSPYEIIVVDNGSEDGTDSYLKGLGGQVRYRLLDTNRGLAGAVNIGLTMAKGTTILVLHDDTLVTDNWLDNMLKCLNSDPQIGLVGPGTNSSAGEKASEGLRQRSRSDAKQWRPTHRLAECCVLFRRELFEDIGFFDEGDDVAGGQVEDYCFRARLLGKSLVVSGDTLIHHDSHVGTAPEFQEAQANGDREKPIVTDRWHQVLQWTEHLRQSDTRLHASLFYPERITVQAMGPTVYWIENGERHPIRGTVSAPPVRVSQVDLRRWPLGVPVDYEDPERELRGLQTPGHRVSGILMLPDETAYHVEGRRIRRIANRAAISAWNLQDKAVTRVNQIKLSDWVVGPPIIAPPVLREPL